MSLYHTPPNFYVSQAGLRVSNLENSLKFYKEILGLQVLSQAPNEAVLSADGKTPLLELTSPSGVKPQRPGTTGLYHLALLLPHRRHLGEFLNHLLSSDYPLQGASNHGISGALYLTDPDGIGIEVYTDTPPESWRWTGGKLQADSGPLDIPGLLEEASQGWILPPQAILGHLHLSVADLVPAEKFFHALGFETVMEFPGQALFFSSGGYHHHIAVNIWNGAGASLPEPNSTGVSYYKIRYPSPLIRELVVHEAQKLGITVDTQEYQMLCPTGAMVRLTLT